MIGTIRKWLRVCLLRVTYESRRTPTTAPNGDPDRCEGLCVVMKALSKRQGASSGAAGLMAYEMDRLTAESAVEEIYIEAQGLQEGERVRINRLLIDSLASYLLAIP